MKKGFSKSRLGIFAQKITELNTPYVSPCELELALLRYGFSNAKAPRFGVLGTHLVPFSFFSNSVGVRKKLQKVRYPLCPPVLNGLPSRAPHTNAFALLAKFALRTRARLTQVCYFLCFDILAF